MKIDFKAIILLLFMALCTTVSMATVNEEATTRFSRYPKMYEEKPQSIVIMPPINLTEYVQAKDLFYTTLYIPLCEKGYYVFPPMLVMEMFQQESAYDAELFINGDLSKFREVLGADAAMFTVVKEWSRNHTGGKLTVDVEFILRSAKTDETLYQREGRITLDISSEDEKDKDDDDGSLLSIFTNMIGNAIASALTDQVNAGRRCVSYVLEDMPVGAYNQKYEKDKDFKAGNKFVEATVK